MAYTEKCHGNTVIVTFLKL